MDQYAIELHRAAWVWVDPAAGDVDLPRVRQAMPITGPGLLRELTPQGLSIHGVRGRLSFQLDLTGYQSPRWLTRTGMPTGCS